MFSCRQLSHSALNPANVANSPPNAIAASLSSSPWSGGGRQREVDLAGRWLDWERGVRNGGFWGILMRAHTRQPQVDHEILFAQNGGYCVKYTKKGGIGLKSQKKGGIVLNSRSFYWSYFLFSASLSCHLQGDFKFFYFLFFNYRILTYVLTESYVTQRRSERGSEFGGTRWGRAFCFVGTVFTFSFLCMQPMVLYLTNPRSALTCRSQCSSFPM
jgi:hypothetical protein